MKLPEFLLPDPARRSGPALRIYMGFVFVVLSGALTIELLTGGGLTGAYWGPQGPMVWVSEIEGCRHCAGTWVEVSFGRYLLAFWKYFAFIFVAVAFVMIAYWHYWEGRNAAG